MSNERGIRGFTIEDENGRVLASNPGQVTAGKRVYKDGVQQDRTTAKRASNNHDYLLRAPKGLWKAFARKCDNEGLTIRGALLFLVKDWVTGRLEIENLATRKKL